MKTSNIAKLAGGFAAVALLAAPQAYATLTFDFIQGNSDISGYGTPYGTVQLTRVDNNNATVTLTALGSGDYLYSFGDGTTLGLNLAGGGTFSYSGVTSTRIGTQSVSYSQSTGNVSEFGIFNFALDTNDGFERSATSLTFNLHTTSGAWTSEDAILAPNDDGNAIVGHVYIRTLAGGNNTGVTGFATVAPVPEPTTLIAGALLLLPFGASTLRILRRKH